MIISFNSSSLWFGWPFPLFPSYQLASFDQSDLSVLISIIGSGGFGQCSLQDTASVSV